MKVKIIKSMKNNLWYRSLIGEEKEVTMIDGLYVLKSNPFYKLYPEDCEEVESIRTKAKKENIIDIKDEKGK